MEEVFLQAIYQQPADWTTYAAYADWLEEQGRAEESECWRWLREKKRHPSHERNAIANESAFWWNKLRRNYRDSTREDFAGYLPRVLLSFIQNCDRLVVYSSWFSTIEEAYSRLLVAWKQLSPAEKQEVWEWQGEEILCNDCLPYASHPENPFKSIGYLPERDPEGDPVGVWTNCKTCNAGGPHFIHPGVLRITI